MLDSIWPRPCDWSVPGGVSAVQKLKLRWLYAQFGAWSLPSLSTTIVGVWPPYDMVGKRMQGSSKCSGIEQGKDK